MKTHFVECAVGWRIATRCCAPGGMPRRMYTMCAGDTMYARAQIEQLCQPQSSVCRVALQTCACAFKHSSVRMRMRLHIHFQYKKPSLHRAPRWRERPDSPILFNSTKSHELRSRRLKKPFCSANRAYMCKNLPLPIVGFLSVSPACF